MVKALVILMFPVVAHAQFFTGNDLHERINSELVSSRSLALGYVGGVLDAFLGSDICPPQQVQLGQALDVVKRWLAANPDKRHLSASVITFHALRLSWPCKESLSPAGKG